MCHAGSYGYFRCLISSEGETADTATFHGAFSTSRNQLFFFCWFPWCALTCRWRLAWETKKTFTMFNTLQLGLKLQVWWVNFNLNCKGKFKMFSLDFRCASSTLSQNQGPSVFRSLTHLLVDTDFLQHSSAKIWSHELQHWQLWWSQLGRLPIHQIRHVLLVHQRHACFKLLLGQTAKSLFVSKSNKSKSGSLCQHDQSSVFLLLRHDSVERLATTFDRKRYFRYQSWECIAWTCSRVW